MLRIPFDEKVLKSTEYLGVNADGPFKREDYRY